MRTELRAFIINYTLKFENEWKVFDVLPKKSTFRKVPLCGSSFQFVKQFCGRFDTIHELRLFRFASLQIHDVLINQSISFRDFPSTQAILTSWRCSLDVDLLEVSIPKNTLPSTLRWPDCYSIHFPRFSSFARLSLSK